MTPSRQTICLSMIVKNEAHVIGRCLASVQPIVDHWLIVDTGSTDDTQAVVRKTMAGKPGALVERPWVDFAYNRTEALALARPHADYSLVIDADDELVLPAGFAMPDLTAESYFLDARRGDVTYQRTQIVRNSRPWRYRGVVHEFLDCAGAQSAGRLPILMQINRDGRRSTDATTYAKDAAILATALATETDPLLVSRYTFYLAQSYRDCGQKEAALDAYLRRADLGFWDQEVYVSLCQAGRLMEMLGRDPDEALAIYARASATCPSRIEAVHAASRLCRVLGRHAAGYALAKPVSGRAPPAGGLFVEQWIYEFGLDDEFAVNACWAGHYRDSLEAALRALRSGKVPPEEQPRIKQNARLALERMLEQGIPPA